MNKIRMITYGITLSSLVTVGIAKLYPSPTIAASTGNLTLVANGEDFVRQGFVSKDGWQIDFDHLYVNLDSAIAYSTESAYEPQKNDQKENIEYQNKVELLSQPQVVDLAEGVEDADPIAVAEADVPVGFYNALAWSLNTAQADSPMAGNTMMLVGQATKDGQTVNFNLGLNQPTEYICGEFVGDARQGIVEADALAQTEMTFHFDHVFGDADTPPEDALNQHALGFEPIAQLASNSTVKLNESDLAEQLAPEDYQQLTSAVTGLGHVGEGHCVVTNSQ